MPKTHTVAGWFVADDVSGVDKIVARTSNDDESLLRATVLEMGPHLLDKPVPEFVAGDEVWLSGATNYVIIEGVTLLPVGMVIAWRKPS